jgi:Uma2 family endonuclease
MRLEPAFQPITAEQFLAMDFGSDRKFELVDGAIRMMTGGTSTHALVAANTLSFLRLKLRGTGCRPYGSDMAVRVDETNVRYPDVSVYCGDPADRDKPAVLSFADPRVIFEVLSPSTRRVDQEGKLREYRALSSMDTIVLIDTDSERSRVHQRLGPTSWRDDIFPQPHDIDLPSLGIVLPHDEIFARD